MLWLGYLASPPDRRNGHTVVRSFDVPPGATTATVTEALADLVERHETLRTTFHLPADGDAYQAVHPATPVPLREVCCADDAVDQTAAVATTELRAVAFDLATPGLVLATLVIASDTPRVLVLATHHIVVDGWSWQVLRREFVALVRAGVDSAAAPLPPVRCQPLDQAAYERSSAGQRTNTAALRYWERQIAAMPDRVLRGSGDPVSTQQVAVLRSPALGRALPWLGARYRIADSTLVLAVFGAVLGVVTGRAESIVMTMSANRLTTRTRDLVACLAQYTVVRIDLADDPTFAELLDRAGAAVLTAYRHGHYDFSAMKALEAEQAARRGLVFSQPAGLNFLRYAAPTTGRAEPGPVPDLSTTDSVLDVRPTSGGCARGVVLLSVRPPAELELLGDGDALSSAELATLLRAVETLVIAGVADPGRRLSTLPALSGLRPPAPDPDWALVDNCWVCLPEIAQALRECPGVTAAGAFAEDGKLVAYVAVTAPLSEDDVRAHALRAAAAGRAVLVPHRSVLCRSAPDDERDLAAWRRQEPAGTYSL